MDQKFVLDLLVMLQLHLTPCSEAAFTVSLELQGGDCSDQLTLICRHSDAITPPQWKHNGTVEGGTVLSTALPGAVYTVQTRTEHTTTITGIDNVRALDGHLIQCAYDVLGNLIKSNAVKYSFSPADYQPALSTMSFTTNFSERLSTFTYSFQESCSLYPRCTPYFSVEHTVSPQSVVSNTSSGCSVEYTVLNLMRCVSYQSTATALLGNQMGNTIVVGTTVMLSPGRFNITSVSIGADNDLINVTYMEFEPDCPGYPTERYTIDVDEVQVADMTADEVQSLAINHRNGSKTLSLPLTQRLSESAVTMNMTKFNTVPTKRSDDMGNIVTEMVTWGTSAVFGLQAMSSPPGGETPAAANDKVALAVGAFTAGIVVIVDVSVVVCVICTWKNRKRKQACIINRITCIACTWRSRKRRVFRCGSHNQMMTAYPRGEGPADTSPGSYDETATRVHEKGTRTRAAARSGQQYAEVDFAKEASNPVLPSDMFVVQYAKVDKA